MTLLKPPRLIVLAAVAAFALLLGFLLSATLVAPSVSASGVSVSNLVIRSILIDPQTKVATAKGALTCTGAKRARLVIEATQPVGRKDTAYASTDTRVDCDGRERFTIELTNYQGRLVPGYATVGAYSEAWTRHDYDFAPFSGVLQVSMAY